MALGALGGFILETIIIKEEEFTGIGGAIGSIGGWSVGYMIGDQTHKRPLGVKIRCAKCSNTYQIHLKIPKIRCPICNTKLKINWNNNEKIP